MTPDNRERYSRQIRFAGLGEAGQAKLLTSHVAIVGCGALGSFQAGALARAGIGRLTVIDRDYVEWSNLQRQWLFEESDAREGLPKAIAAAKRISAINSACAVTPQIIDLTACNIGETLEGADLVLDGTDNFETRYLINDWCVRERIPWIYGAAVGSYGITMPIIPGETACLSCVYPNPPTGAQPTCETSGVLGPVTAIIAAQQSADAMKIVAGQGSSLERRITTIDVWTGAMRQIAQHPRDPECEVCAHSRFVYLDPRRRAPVSLCGRNAVQIHERHRSVDMKALSTQLRSLGEVRCNEFALRFTAPPYDLTVFPDGRAIIKGTTDVGIARSVYARYIGG